MSATANIFGDELFDLDIDVVPRVPRGLETIIFFWRRIFSGRASADGGLLPENRRQRLVKNPSRSMRLRDKWTPFFVWLHHRAFGKADCAAMCSSIVAAAESKAVLWTSSSGATDTNLVVPARNLLPKPVAASGDKKISVSTLIASSTRMVEIAMVYSRYLYCGTCVPHGKSVHALPRLVGADWCDDPTVRSTLGLRNRCRASQ